MYKKVVFISVISLAFLLFSGCDVFYDFLADRGRYDGLVGTWEGDDLDGTMTWVFHADLRFELFYDHYGGRPYILGKYTCDKTSINLRFYEYNDYGTFDGSESELFYEIIDNTLATWTQDNQIKRYYSRV